MNSHSSIFRIFVIAVEFIILNLSSKLAYLIRFDEGEASEAAYVSFSIFFTIAWIASSLFTNAYDKKRLLNLNAFLQSLVLTFLVHLSVITFYIVGAKLLFLSREYLIYAHLTSVGSVLIFRILLLMAYRYYNGMTYTIRKIAIVGADKGIADLANHFDAKNTQLYYFLQGDLAETGEAKKERIWAEIHRLKQLCIDEGVNEIYFSLSLLDEDMVEELSDFADNNFIYFRMVTNYHQMGRRPLSVEFFGQTPILSLRRAPLQTYFNQVLKRAFDVAFSLGVIIFTYPILLPVISALIKLESKGPVFFKQLRTGKNGKEFLCYKFRTMTVNNDSDAKQATKGDARVTRIGSILRKTSLDEFPQFLNVLWGDMSVVGPRPHMLKHTDEYSQTINKYLVRHFITPGITGYAQVNGYRGATTDPSLMAKRVEHDAWYVENWSLLLDLKIIFLTVWNVFKGEENAY